MPAPFCLYISDFIWAFFFFSYSYGKHDGRSQVPLRAGFRTVLPRVLRVYLFISNIIYKIVRAGGADPRVADDGKTAEEVIEESKAKLATYKAQIKSLM